MKERMEKIMNAQCTHKGQLKFIETSLMPDNTTETRAECLGCEKQFIISGEKLTTAQTDAIRSGSKQTFSMGAHVGCFMCPTCGKQIDACFCATKEGEK